MSTPAPRLPLPNPDQPLPLPQLVQAVGPALAAVAFDGINTFGDIAREAAREGNPILRLAATKIQVQEVRKWSELSMGRTLNINTAIKSQRDIPRFDRLSPERRAELEAIYREMSQPDLDAHPTETADGPDYTPPRQDPAD